MKAVIYARFSSEKQTEQSIEGQVRVCREYATRNGYEIVRIYDDHAVTGRNDNRPKFQQMLSDSEKHEFEAVLVYKLDRFSRNRYDSAHNKSLLKKNGVKVVSATENISDNPEGILLESLLEGLAEYYSAELAQKVKRGIRESLLKGQFLGGQIPYGYDIIDKKYVINQKEAEIVRKIHTQYLSGDSIQEIIRQLNSHHVTNKKGGKFKFHQVYNILTKEIYIGTLKGADLVLPDVIPNIIEKEKFIEVQRLMDKNNPRHQKKTNFILSGKLFCMECGSPMTGTSGTGRNNSYFYYKCKKDGLTVRKDKLEDYVIKALKDFLCNSSAQELIVEKLSPYLNNNTQESYKKEIIDKIKKIDSDLSKIADAVLNGIVNDAIKEKNQDLLKQKEDLIYELDKMKSYPTIISSEQVYAFFKELAESEEKEDEEFLIKTLVYKVLFSKEKIYILLNISPNEPKDNTFDREFLEIPNDLGSSNAPQGLPVQFDCKYLQFFYAIF